MRLAHSVDAPLLDQIRALAFAPIFASFRAVLGTHLFQLTQTNCDTDQSQYLASILMPDSGWEVYVATVDGVVVGFVSLQLNQTTHIGEIGLNAVHPDWSGRGIGTAMYTFATTRMRATGMRAAVVSTGGDDSHAPARRAYANAGFTVGIPSVWLCQSLD
jgi:GNAT superfamily N-acetyltransferase